MVLSWSRNISFLCPMVSWGSWPWAASLGFHFAAAEVEQRRSQRAGGRERWCQQHQWHSTKVPQREEHGHLSISGQVCSHSSGATAPVSGSPWGTSRAPAMLRTFPSWSGLEQSLPSPWQSSSTRTSRESFGSTFNCEHPMFSKSRDGCMKREVY